MSVMSQPVEGSDRFKELAALWTKACELCAGDAANDRDPQTLLGELAQFQDDYDDSYTEKLVQLAEERSSN